MNHICKRIYNLNISSLGELNVLSKNEIKNFARLSRDGTKYKYSTTGSYSINFTLRRDTDIYCCVDIPKGFLTNGSNGSPDYGISWLFHDYLYATHCMINAVTGDAVPCTRKEADALMAAILKYESTKEFDVNNYHLSAYAKFYRKGVIFISYTGFLGFFPRAWRSSGKRGPEFIDTIF